MRRALIASCSSRAGAPLLQTSLIGPSTRNMASAAPAHDFLSFVNASPTPYHAVDSVKSRLEKAGFHNVKERDAWSSAVKPGGKYYTTRNGSSIVAFALGKQWRPGSPFAMVGAHTDSCCLKVKPISKKQSDGFLQVGVETYGGGLWHTWFDRDLSLAGRVMVRAKSGRIEPRLVNFVRPILRVPSLAIHLDRQEPFAFDKEAQLLPFAGLVAAELDRQGGVKASQDSTPPGKTAIAPLKALTERHHSYIVELAADKAGVSVDDVVDIELAAYDTNKSCVGGLNDEFVLSARLDNLEMCYCATQGLIGSLESPSSLASDNTVRIMSLFDHEEIGSLSAQGADSNLLPAVINRLSALPTSLFEGQNSEDSYDKMSSGEEAAALEQSLATSFLLSADMAHSVNPNYASKYEPDARPEMNKGVVFKWNGNQRYMTNSPGSVLLQEIAKKARGGTVPLQTFFIKNGTPIGSTIGPMLAGKLGSRTIDMGNPQLAMHSIRETGGVYDIDYAIRLFESFWTHYGEMEKNVVVD